VSGLASKPLGRIFAGLTSKPMVTVFTGLALKSVVTVSDGLVSKPAAMISSCLASKPATMVFSSLALKLVVMVSPTLASNPAVSFLVEPQNQCDGGFPSLGLKISSSSLVIWVLKSPRRFLGLWLKTKQTSTCRLHHKTDGGRSTRDMRRDLMTCFAWKEI
jgi:hypothetical protein